MLRFFRSNQLSNVFFLVLYTGLVQLGYFLWPPDRMPDITFHGPSYDLLLDLWPALGSNHTLRHFSSIICLMLTASFINAIVNKWKFTTSSSMLTALGIVLLGSMFYAFTAFGPIWIALILIAPILWQLFLIYGEEQITQRVFYIGFSIGVASTFYPPAIGLLVWVIIGLATIRKFVLREHLVILTGVLVPWIWLLVGYFWFDQLTEFWSYVYHINFAWDSIQAGFHEVDWLKTGVIFSLITGLIFRLTNSLSTSVIQLRKFVRIILLIGPISIIPLLLAFPLSLNDFLLLIIPGGFALGYSLATFEQRMASETVHLVVLALILIGQYVNFAIFNWLS